MADEPITGLPSATTPLAGTEPLAIVQGGVTVQTTSQAIANLAPTSGTVTSLSVIANNGITQTVNNPTTTPEIVLGLGNITPTSVNASGTVQGSNLSGTNTGDQTITLTGDVTGSGTGSFAATIANNAVTTAKIANSAITYAKIQNVTANRLLGNPTGSAAAPSEISLSSGLAFISGVLTNTASRPLGSIVSEGAIGNSQPETTMGSITLQASTLSGTGNQCIFSSSGTYETDPAGLTLRFKFGSATIVTVPVNDLEGNPASKWTAQFKLTRSGAVSMTWELFFVASDETSMVTNNFVWTANGTVVVNWAISNAVFMTGETDSTASVTWQAGTTLIKTV